jgi:osmoprotectant transport system permease protein
VAVKENRMLIEPLQLASRYVFAHPARFNDALFQHVLLTASALCLAFLLAFPLGILVAHQRDRLRWIIPLFSGLRVIPSLAILALMIPLLGTGFLPALVALVILAMPSILINTTSGLTQVSADVQEAARGMGMTSLEIFNRVTLPLASPSIITGLRTATVEVVASATLAALIGGGGMGIFIINGLSMYNFGLLLVGALPVVIMALLAEMGFGMLERMATRYRAC